MSIFSWFSSTKKKAGKAAPVTPESSGLSRMDSTKPYPLRGANHPGVDNGKPANRKNERMARRELLYGVVRESMTKAGVISASYKFKVLSLDGLGRQFLVMVDLAREYGAETSSLAEIEATIAQSAKSRYDILVSAVYWRMNEHVAVGVNLSRPQAHATAVAPPVQTAFATPAPPVRRDYDETLPPGEVFGRTKPLVSEPRAARDGVVAPLSRTGARFEPIQNDEVEAFRKALAGGSTGAAALAAAGGAAADNPAGPGNGGAAAKSFDGTAVHGPQSYTLLTGFEDTEMIDGESGDSGKPGALSATQYGDLR